MENRPELTGNISRHANEARSGTLMFSIVGEKKLRKILHKMLDENEFLSPYGIRSRLEISRGSIRTNSTSRVTPTAWIITPASP